MKICFNFQLVFNICITLLLFSLIIVISVTFIRSHLLVVQ